MGEERMSYRFRFVLRRQNKIKKSAKYIDIPLLFNYHYNLGQKQFVFVKAKRAFETGWRLSNS